MIFSSFIYLFLYFFFFGGGGAWLVVSGPGVQDFARPEGLVVRNSRSELPICISGWDLGSSLASFLRLAQLPETPKP